MLNGAILSGNRHHGRQSVRTITSAIVCFGILVVFSFCASARAELDTGLASKIIAADCGPAQPIDWRVTTTDSDVEVIAKLVSSAKLRIERSSSGPEPCEQLLVGWIREQANTEHFIQSLRDFVSYLIIAPGPPSSVGAPAHKFPPFLSGALGSTRRAVIASLEDALISHDGPIAHSALLFFADLDDNELALKARNASRAELKVYPWLIHPEWGAWIANGVRADERKDWQKGYPQNARSSLADFSFQAPYELPYGFPLLRKLSQLTQSPQEPPTPDQELAGDKTTWDAVYALANAGLLVAGRPDLVEERNSTRDQAIESLRMFLLGPQAANFDIGTLDWVAAKTIDLENGLGTDTSSFDERVRLTNTASLLARLELERRATVLFALLMAKKGGIAVSASTDLVNADAELDRISGETHAGFTETKIIDSLDLAAIQKNNSEFDAASKSCELDRIDLIGRQVSFADGKFVENFALTCHDGRHFSYQFVDQIPAGYAVSWKRHARLFDFMQLSITALMADSDSWRTRTPDIDLVRGVPQLSVPVMLVALRKPDLPWQYLREYMLLDYKPSFGWLAHVDPPPTMMNQIVVGQGNVAQSDATYDQAHDWLIGRMTTFLNFVAKKAVVNALMPIALKMDDNIRDCPAPWGSLLGDSFCNKSPNNTKRQLVSALNSLDEQAKAANLALQKTLFGIDTAKCKSGAEPGTTRIQILFNSALTKYLVRYTWNDAATSEYCDFGFERQFDVSKEFAEAIRQAFSQDATALAKFNLDIAATGADDGYRTAVAIGNAARLKENYAAAEQLLHSIGLYPLYKNFLDLHPNDTDYFYTSYGGLADAVKWPILRKHLVNSDDGLQYDAEFGIFDYIFQRFQPPALRFVDQTSQQVPTIQPTDLDPHILSSVVALNEELVNQALQVAQGQIDATIDKLKAQDNNWAFGISIGTNGFNTSGMLQFSFNGKGVGIGFSMPELAVTDLAPNLNGFRIPISIPHSSDNGDRALLVADVIDHAAAPDSPPPVLPGTSVAIPWTATPPVSWAPGELDTNSPANRQLFAGLLGRAAPALTDADVQKVLDGLKLPVFPEELARFLFAKSYEGFEMQKIADGSWYPTAINLQLLPSKSPGQPCPISGCIDPNNPEELATYIGNFNKSELARFDGEVAAAQAAAGDKHAFASDIPAVRLTYGPGFKVMMTEYSWPTKKGAHLVTMRALQETPVFVIDKIRANPTGHEFEKWAVAITDGFATPVDVSEPTLTKAKLPYIEDTADQFKAVQGVATDPLFQTFSKQLEQAWKDFWSGWKVHGENEIGAGSKDAFIEPFVPPPLSTPVLRFFDPPWQHAYVNGMTMEDWLIYERSTDFYKRIGEGGIPGAPRQ